MEAPRRPGQRAGLSRAAVLRAARAVLRDRGADGLSMRSVAERAGVHANALYSHVGGKDELVDDLLDEALAAVRTSDPDGADPLDAVQKIFASTYEVLHQCPELVPLYLARRGVNGPNARALGALVVHHLVRVGLAADQAEHALHAFIGHTIGAAALDVDSADDDTAAAFDRSLGWLIAGAAARRGP